MTRSKPWLVQKFGGTSIAKFLDTVVDSVVPHAMQEYNVAIVCSARSHSTKMQGTTSMLLEAINRVVASGESTSSWGVLIDAIKDDHLAAAYKLFSGEDTILYQDLCLQIAGECQRLKELLVATQALGEISERAKDRVISVGEKLSSHIAVAAFKRKVRTPYYIAEKHSNMGFTGLWCRNAQLG